MATTPIKNAYMDVRFDMGNSTSAANINPELAHLKAVGYNTVTLAAQVSVNLQTGAADAGKPLPADFWNEVDYAHSIGLNVFIRASIDVGFNADGSWNGGDPVFQKNTVVGSGVSVQQIFNNAAAYEKSLASQAQAHHVEGFFVGSNNWGFDDTQAAQQYFKPIIDSVRSVYSGQIGYEAIYNNAVFGMVNIVDYEIRPNIGSGTSVDQIVSQWNALGATQSLKNMANAYSGQTFLAHYYDEAQAGIGNPSLIWTTFMNNPAALSSIQVNYTEQVMAYQAFIQVAHNAGVKGVTYSEYDPWVVYSSPSFQQAAKLGLDLWSSPVEGQIAGTLAAL